MFAKVCVCPNSYSFIFIYINFYYQESYWKGTKPNPCDLVFFSYSVWMRKQMLRIIKATMTTSLVHNNHKHLLLALSRNEGVCLLILEFFWGSTVNWKVWISNLNFIIENLYRSECLKKCCMDVRKTCVSENLSRLRKFVSSF